MITYNSSDIIKKAKQLADLENSDFISWNENLTLLNDAFSKTYQDMINQNDKYWLKTIYLIPSTQLISNEIYYTLPSDFYQLYSLSVSPTMVPVLRRSKNEPKTAQRYDIINGQIVIYGTVTANLELQYYPVPNTITFPASDLALSLDSANYLDCNGNKYLSINGSVVSIFDNSLSLTSTLATLPVTPNKACGILGKKNAIIWDASLSYSSVSFYVIDLYTGNINTIVGNFYPAKKDNEVYLIQTNGTTNEIILYKYTTSWNSIVVESFEGVFLNTADLTTNASFDSNNNIYYCSGGNIYVFNLSSLTTTTLNTYINEMHIEFNNGLLYYNDKFNNIYSGTNIVIKGEDVTKILGLNKADSTKGYGITIISSEDTSYTIKSIFIDTVLNYPYNILYSILAFYLAIAYKIKQNADITLLSQQLELAELQYFDMLNNDANCYTRITNAYASCNLF